MSLIISIDPGTEKCGLLLADLQEEIVLEGRVVHHSSVISLIVQWQAKGFLKAILLGNGTSSQYWEKSLEKLLNISVVIVEERGSTLRARIRYWELWPPTNWLRFLPRGLILPPGNLDAVAALILLEDYLDKKLSWHGPTNFKILHEP